MAVGITGIQDLNINEFEGALITDELKSEGVILIKKNSPVERQRFTVGHEVGHFLNYWHQPPKGGFYCSKLDMLASGEGGSKRAQMESEANEFAAEMLMPEPLFRGDLNKGPSPGLEHVVRWSADYETSKLATTRRLVDLCDSPSALVQSKDGVVGYVHRRKDTFPFVELKRGMAIPKKSLTARFSGSEDGCSNTDETEPSHWISRDLRRGATMLEQVLVQGNGYRITLLTIDETESEDEDDSYGRERSEWNPRFR
jgi:Zn-dependent peptidase ImmA (M78 family)